MQAFARHTGIVQKTSGTRAILIHPPVALPSEPPLGISLLARRLIARGWEVTLCDANVEALHYLVQSAPGSAAQRADPPAGQARMETRARRALGARQRAITMLRSTPGYQNRDRYHSAVNTIRQILLLSGHAASSTVALDIADYHEQHLSPLCHADLLQAARAYADSPFYAYYRSLLDRLRQIQPQWIGLSVNYLHQALPSMALAGLLHHELPQVPLSMGGALIRCWQDRLVSASFRPYINALFFDDGRSLLEIVGSQDLGVSVPSQRSLRAQSTVWGQWPWELYLAPMRIIPFATSLGCVWGRCRYCPEAMLGPPFSALVPEQIPRLVDDLRREVEPGLLHFTDSTIPPATLEVLARQQWSARWYGFTRFSPRLTDPDFCRQLKRSGCVMLQLGLESGAPRVLQRLNKGIVLEQVATALAHLADAGIPVYLYIMFGVPGERREDALQTLSFVVDHAAAITYLNTSLLNMPAGTPADPDLCLTPLPGERNDLFLYQGFSSESGWDRRAARFFLERVFAQESSIARVLRRTPPVFGANHAAFFSLLAPTCEKA